MELDKNTSARATLNDTNYPMGIIIHPVANSVLPTQVMLFQPVICSNLGLVTLTTIFRSPCYGVEVRSNPAGNQNDV